MPQQSHTHARATTSTRDARDAARSRALRGASEPEVRLDRRVYTLIEEPAQPLFIIVGACSETKTRLRSTRVRVRDCSPSASHVRCPQRSKITMLGCSGGGRRRSHTPQGGRRCPSLLPAPAPALLLLAVLAGAVETERAADDKQRVPLAEADALRELRRQVGPPQSGKMMSAVEETKQQMAEDAFAKDVCTMKGVTCADGHVTVVSLRKTGLAGALPPELQMFSRLKALDLSHNKLQGPIPRWITNFRLLEKLNLAENRLSGGLPLDLGNLASLDTLIVADNELSGVLPNDLSDLHALRRLDVAGNEFTGQIPTTMGALPNLRRVNWQHGELVAFPSRARAYGFHSQ